MKILSGPAPFEVDGATYDWEDILISAMIRDEWAPIERDARFGLAAQARAAAEGTAPSDDEVKALGRTFRRSRGLTAAKDMQAWLEAWSLSIDDWMGWLARASLRDRWATDRDALLEAWPVDAAAVSAILHPEAAISGALAGFARALATRAAVDARRRAAHTPADEHDGTHLPMAATTVTDRGVEGIAPERLREKVLELSRLEAGFQRFCQEVAAPEQVIAHLRSQSTDWILADYRLVAFSDEEAAREAMLCVRDDGMSLEEVAAESRVGLDSRRQYLRDIDPWLRPLILGAARDELIGPFRHENRFVIAQLVEKTVPSPDDVALQRRVGGRLLQSVIDLEVSQRIRWTAPL